MSDKTPTVKWTMNMDANIDAGVVNYWHGGHFKNKTLAVKHLLSYALSQNPPPPKKQDGSS